MSRPIMPFYSDENYGAQSHLVVKIHDGTTRGTGNLCRTCRSAHVVRGTNNQQIIECGRLGNGGTVMLFDVAECNRYDDRTKPSLGDMEEVAWRLVTKKSNQSIGFVDPGEFRRLRDKENK